MYLSLTFNTNFNFIIFFNLKIQVIASQKFEYKIVKHDTNEEIPIRIEPRLNNLQKIYFELLTGPKFSYYTVKSNQIEAMIPTNIANRPISNMSNQSSNEMPHRKYSTQSDDSAYASRAAEMSRAHNSGRSSTQTRACSTPPSVYLTNAKSDAKRKLRNSKEPQINVQLKGERRI